MRDVTGWFVLLAPLVILGTDYLVYVYCGYEATITAVVREWHLKTGWAEFVFLTGVVLLYVHLFRDWPRME